MSIIHPSLGKLPRTHKNAPVLVTAVAAKIRESAGIIWLLEKQEFGLQIRATINRQNVRIVVPPISGPALPVPAESNSTLYLVLNVEELGNWLKIISSPTS